MKISKQKAKLDGLKMWGYLKDHPSIKRKYDLPEPYYTIWYRSDAVYPACDHCSGGKKCLLNIEYGSCGDYYNWCHAETDETRKKYATIIYDKIKAW